MFDFCEGLPKDQAQTLQDLALCDAALELLPNSTDSEQAWAVLSALRDRLTRRSNGVEATEGDFMAGRNLAVEMLREAQTVEAGAISVASIEAQYREGKPQVNFVRTYLNRIRERPELAEGFAAVLSDSLTVSADVDVYARLSYREITG